MREEWFDNEGSHSMEKLLKRFVDGEPVNVNPLKEIPDSEMKLYTVHGVLRGAFFSSFDEFNNYINSNSNLNPYDVGTVEYLRECAGKSDVIKFTSINGNIRLYAACDEYGYCIYNNERSIYRGEFTWEYFHGRLSCVYEAFRDRGIVFGDGLKIQEKNKKLYKKMKEVFN